MTELLLDESCMQGQGTAIIKLPLMTEVGSYQCIGRRDSFDDRGFTLCRTLTRGDKNTVALGYKPELFDWCHIRLSVVADDVASGGGRGAAADIVVDTFEKCFKEFVQQMEEGSWDTMSYEDLGGVWLLATAWRAHRAVVRAQEESKELATTSGESAERAKMKSTMAALLAIDNLALVIHAGDSGCYFCRDGVVQPVTVDHVWNRRAELTKSLSQPRPVNSVPDRAIYSSAGQRRSPFTSCHVSHELSLAIEVLPEMGYGDVFILTTDGLKEDVLRTGKAIWGLPAQGIAAALGNERGDPNEGDNTFLYVIKYEYSS